MRLRTTLAALCAGLAATLATPAAAHAAGDDGPSTRIIGGETVASAPWSAQIYRNGSFTCSGSVIAARWVLTAAHCTGSGMSVRIGSVYRGSGTSVTVSNYYTRNDMALLYLSSAAGTSFVTLGTANPPVNSTNSIYGWGRTCYSGCDAASQLKTATVRVTGLTTDAYGGQAIASRKISGAAWKGDSGGPQFYNGRQVGVASTANGSDRQNYASVAFHRAWITQTSGV